MSATKARDVFPLLWQAIDHLEVNNIHVLSITGDGATVNQKAFQMHGTSTLTQKCFIMFTKG